MGVVSLKSCSVEWLIFEYVATVVVEESVVAIVAAVAIAVAVAVEESMAVAVMATVVVADGCDCCLL